MIQRLNWETLKSRDSKHSVNRFLDRGEIEIWSDGRIQCFPVEKCPENASRCLHLDAKWINGFGLQCPDCQQRWFFGTFDALRWVIRQIQLLRSSTGNLLSQVKSSLLEDKDNAWDFSCVDLVQEAIETNRCEDCCDGEVYAGCYLCDAEAAGADHTHSKCDSYFAPCNKCDKGRELSNKLAALKSA